MTKLLVISNMEPDDITFTSDVGAWNISRAQRDCAAGLHKTYAMSIAETIEATENVDVDPAKIDSMVADPARLGRSPPVIFIFEHERVWLIDGHHRVRALGRLGFPECLGYVIEEKDAKPYRIYFNGKRTSPPGMMPTKRSAA
jgi:hypothetical protein